MDNSTKQTLAEVLFALSVVAVLFAAWSYLSEDIWLASSQWVEVGTVCGIWATYLHIKGPEKKR